VHHIGVNDTEVLEQLNVQFIDAFRKGSWEVLGPILTPTFKYLSGATGEIQELPEYIEDLQTNPGPTIEIDQVVIHLDGDSAVVSSRVTADHQRYSRYVDSYHRGGPLGWTCFHACVWPIESTQA
jgi:hypothetical protein